MQSIPSRLSCLVLIALASCASEQQPAAPVTAPPAAPAPPVAKQVAAPAPATAPALIVTAQPGWVVEQPTSEMRKAQYRLPHVAGDDEDASLIVYYFGGQGGSKEANLQRWASQFEQPDGGSSEDEMQSRTRSINDLEVFDADLSGTYVAETAPGSGERVNKPDWRMLASIVDTKEGPWYFKLVGPTATVTKWESSYDTCIMGLKRGK